MKEEKDLNMFDDLLTTERDDNVEPQPGELKPLDPTDDPLLNDFVNSQAQDTDPVEDPNDNTEPNNKPTETVSDFLHEFLKSKGIEDPSKLQ